MAVHTHGRTVDEMVLRSPSGLKSALGENPKRVYGEQKKTPSTRLGTAAVIRQAFVEARNYLDMHTSSPSPGKPPPARNLTSEALGLVLTGSIPWRQHCHRADDIATAVRIADEFGYRLVIDHGTEAHLIADLLVRKGIPVLIGPLFTSRSKVELRNRSLANPGRLAAAGVEISIITDHPVVPIHFLVHQATLSVKEGLRPGHRPPRDHHQPGPGAGRWTAGSARSRWARTPTWCCGAVTRWTSCSGRCTSTSAAARSTPMTRPPGWDRMLGVSRTDAGACRRRSGAIQRPASRPTRRAQSTSGICSGNRSHSDRPVPAPAAAPDRSAIDTLAGKTAANSAARDRPTDRPGWPGTRAARRRPVRRRH